MPDNAPEMPLSAELNPPADPLDVNVVTALFTALTACVAESAIPGIPSKLML